MSEDPIPSRRWHGEGGDAAAAGQAQARRGNRRRLLVFVLSFIVACLLGQAWNFSRPALYRADTRLQVNLPEVGRPGMSASGAYATKLQLFDSRPMLAKLADALLESGVPASRLGSDPAGRLQSMLQLLPVQGSEIVELRAVGTDPRLLADMLNAYPDVVRKELAARQANDADTQLAVARQELERLERASTEGRARLAAFRQREGVLADRDDNDAVARSKGLNQALDAAVEKEAAAAARLGAVAKAVEQGRTSTRVRADPALSALETRTHQLREDLKELERSYTADFLAMDPRARAMRARLVELEQQLVQQRALSLQAALQAAQEEHASTQAQVERLRAQLGAARPVLAKTAARLAEAKVLEDDLAQIDKARRDVLERVSRLEADEQRRVATIAVVEAATVPTAPFRPDHGRDAAWVAAAAAGLALLVMATVEVFNRSAPVGAAASNTTVVLAPAWADRPARLGDGGTTPPLLDGAPGPPSAPAALPAPMRVLSQAEAAALLAASDGPSRWLCALGLMGLSIGEALAVRPRDLDARTSHLLVAGPWARRLPMPPWLPDALPEGSEADRSVLHDAAGQALQADDVATMIIGAALDGGLDRAAAMTWDVLRHTSMDWLVGQGLRYGDLPKLVGRIDTQMLQVLSSRHGDAKRRDLHEVDVLMPALRLRPTA